MPLTDPSLTPDEPLSPELVLVLPPEQRARVIEALGPPVRHLPPLRVATRPAPVVDPAEASSPLRVAARPAPVVEPAEASSPLRVVARPAPVEVPPAPSLTRLIAARLVSLGVIFVVATIATLALSLVAHALRTP